MENKKKPGILIVDDENANIIALTYIFNPEYTVYAAKNGQYAIKVAKKHIPDLILLDVLMPEMDGFEVLSLLKSDEETRNIPVILVTGLDSAENRDKGLALGAAEYIIKPFVPSIVRQKVRDLIQAKI